MKDKNDKYAIDQKCLDWLDCLDCPDWLDCLDWLDWLDWLDQLDWQDWLHFEKFTKLGICFLT